MDDSIGPDMPSSRSEELSSVVVVKITHGILSMNWGTMRAALHRRCDWAGSAPCM
jgi:hypothetical protein